MKLLKLVIVSALVLPGLALAMSGSDIDFHGYMRAGGGMNSKGGDMTCAGNGTAGNEFRLGNECDNYGEFALTYHHKKAKGDESFFDTKILMTSQQNADVNWENNNALFLREAYFEGGKFNGTPLTYWAGKRYYRENDVHMNDFYYFADTEPGFGGGVGNIPVHVGNLHLAYLQNTSTASTSTSGNHKVGIFDARLKDVKITSNDTLKFWLAYALNTEGDKTTTQKYDRATGQAYGVHHEHSLASGFNHFSIVYGKGLMEGLATYGSAQTSNDVNVYAADSDYNKNVVQRKHRLRFVEHLVLKPMNKLDLAFATTYEKSNDGKDKFNSKTDWYNFGVNPVYFFTDNYSLAGVLGQSVVDSSGSSKKTLTRLTIAPQVSIDAGYWARPVIRAFYTRTMWNTANRGSVNSGGPYAQETALWNVGIQGEVFF